MMKNQPSCGLYALCKAERWLSVLRAGIAEVSGTWVFWHEGRGVSVSDDVAHKK